MNNFYATKNQPTNCKTTGNTFSLKFKTQWLVMTFAFFALLAGNVSTAYATCNNVTNAGCIADDEANCGTFNPAAIANQASATGGSGTLEYVWKQSTDGGNTWTTISGATSSTYDPSSISVTTKYKRGAKRQYCSSYLWTNIVTKTVNPIPPATITYNGSLNLCTGGSIVLNANTGSGYDYKWYRNGTVISGATSSSYTVTQAGNYKVLVNITATGCCQYSSEVCVTINNCCDNVTNGGTIGSDETNCGPYDPANISNVTSPSGGTGALEYIWQSLVGQGPWVTISGATSATYDPSTITETTCYKRLVRRAGCTDYIGVSNIVVKTVNPLPPAEITYSGSLNLCTGGSIVLQASTGTGYDYKWYRNGTLISGATASSYTVTQAGNYKVLVNITATGCCRYSSEVTVTVNSCCDNVTNGGTIAADQSNCGPFDVALLTSVSAPSGGSGALEIVWITRTWNGSSWGNWNMISGATGLTYDPGVVSVNTQFRRCARRAGCTDYIGESNIITITINTGISVSCSPTNGTCTNGNLGSATVNASGGSGYTYLWNNGATTQTITGLAAGTYSVGVTSANGCSASCSVTISTVACCNVTQPGEIGYNEQNCGSFDPAEIVSLSPPSGGLGNLEIVWIYRTWNGSSWSNWNMISGADGLTYDPSTITVTTQYRRCARRSGCTDYIGETNIITKTVNPGIQLACNMTNVTSYGGSNGIAAVTISGGTAPYTYLWNNGATTASLNNVAAGVYSVTVTDANGCNAFIECCVCQPPLDCVGFRTQTQGGWGAPPNGGNPGVYLHANFAAAFPSGLQVGCTNLLRLTTAQSVTDFLPSGSTASALPSGTLTNPGNSYNNVLAGQVVALTISVGFDQYDANFAPSTTLLKNLLINSGTFAGWTVQQLLDEANRKLGGCSSSYSFSQLNEAVSKVNENFVDGNVTGSYLACCGNITASCSKTDVLCYGGNTGSVSVNASGATAPLSYLWSNGATTASVNNLSAGSYSVTITDARNCTATCSVTVSQPNAQLLATCTSVNGTCTNNNLGSASVIATGGTAPYTYGWSNGATTSSISDLAAGTYSVTVTDANGCTASCSVTITNTACCNVTDGGNIGYDQENCGSFDVAELVSLAPPTGGLGNLEIVWITRSWTGSNWSNWEMIPGSTGLSYNPGTITVTTQYRRCARRAGCTDYIGESNIITITINPNPTAQCSSVNGTCTNNNLGSASVTVSSGTAPFSYAWINGATTSSISGLAAGTYSVTVTDAEGCSTQCSATVTVTPCCNVTNGGQIGTEQENCGPFDPNAITSIQDPTGGLGTLEYVWLYNHNQVPFNNGQNGWVEIPNSNNASYDPGQITQTTCYIRCSRRSGCNDYVGESNVVCMIVNPVPTAQCSSVNGICTNNNLGSASVTVSSGTAPFTYSWSNGSTTSSISGLSAGTYSVTVTDAEGCSTQCSATVTVTPCCNLTNGGQIGTEQENCGPFDPNAISSIQDPTGGLGTLEYVWLYNHNQVPFNNGQNGWVEIPNSNNATYDPGQITQTTCYIRCSRRSGCNDYVGESNVVCMIVNPVPTAQCTSTNGTCTNNNLGSASVTISSGTAPFSYAWNNGETTSSISGLGAGTYSVTVTDAEGCSTQCSATVTVTPCCNVTNGGEIGYDQENCGSFDPSELVTLSPPTGGLGNLEIVWITRSWTGSNWSNWTMISGASGLTYDPSTVTVTTQYRRCARRAGCTDYIGESNIITITVNPVPTAQCSSVNGTCTNNNLGSASVNVTSGTAPFTYLWSNGGTASSISGLTAGTYSVTITDAEGCSAQCSATVTITPCCNVTNGGQIGTEQENCGPFDPNAITSIQDPTGGLGTLEYVWLYNHNQVPFNNGQNGWVEIPNSNNASYDPGQITQTTCYIRCSRRSGCNDYVGESNVVCMIVNPVPTAQCSSVNGICTNNNLGSASVTVSSGTAPFTYLWSNGSTTSSISGLSAGTYSVTVTDAEGCSTQCSATVTVTPCCNVTDGGNIGYDQENCGSFDPSELVNLAPPTGGLGDLEVLWIYRVWTGTGWENDWHFVPGSHDLLSYDPGMITVSTQFRRCARRSGCEDYIGETNIITITINPVPTAQCSKTDVLCYGEQTGSASVSASGGTAPYTYLWNNGGTDAAISGVGAGVYSVTVTDAEGCTATCSVEVSQPQSALLANCEAGYVACYGESTGSAVVLAQGGTAPYSYLWSNGATIANIDGLAAGSYSVTITDANGCTASCSIEVTQPEAPLAAQCSSTDVSCYEAQDGTVSAGVSGGTAPYSYSWSNGATTASVNDLSAGVYSVTVTDAEGCSTTCSVEVGQAAGLEITCSGTPVACNGDASGSASVSASGGTAPYSYLWSNGAATASVNGLQAGVYTVVVTDAHGCSDECSYSVEEPSDLYAQCSASDVLCFGGNDGAVSVVANGGVAPYSYQWSNGSTDATANGLTAGAYSVTVTDANGCTEICTAVIGQPQNELLATCEAGPVSCYGAGDGEAVVLAQGGIAPYTYFWNNEMTEAFIGNLVPGTYTVIVTDANGCTATCSVEVTEPEPFNVSISADGPLTFCEGGSVTLTASAAASYVWLPGGETTQSIVVSTSGSYSVWALDETGCEATSDPVTVVVNPNPTPEVSAGGPLTFCEGECVTLTSTAAASYLWNNGATTQSITVCEAGDYSVSVVDENGCEGTSAPVTAIVNTVEPPVIDVDGEPLACAGECVDLTVLYSGESPNFLWSNGETSQVISVCETGTFTVTYTAENGCSATSEPVTVIINPNPTPEVSAGGPTTFCEGGCVTLTSSEAATYLWSNGATTQSITVCETGSYSVTVTDENGCQGTSAPVSVVVNPNPTPEVSADGPTTFCEGECVILTSSEAASYLWSNGATTQSITVCEAGDYAVSVVDENGCEGASVPVSVVVNSNPTPIISASGPTEFCEGECVTLTSSLAANYLWSNGATTQSITVCEAGSFTVSVVDENGCEGTSAPVIVTVNPNPTPAISADGPTTFCAGNCVTLTATSSASYLWTNGATTQSITVCESGDYGVSVVDENGCQGGSVPVSVNVLEVEPPVINVDGSSIVCAGECVDLIALYSGESPNFVWSTSEVTQIITVCESGSYTVTLTAENGCIATSDPVVITVNPNPVPEVNADGPTTFCEGNCVTLTADAGYASYLWNNGATTQSIFVCEAGQYVVTVFDENGCRGVSDPVDVIINIATTPTVSANGPTAICNGTCVMLTASEGVFYLWSNGETTQSITACEEGSFTVTVTDENGCAATSDPVSVTVIPGLTPEISPEGPIQICEGGCVSLSASFSGEIGYFLWSTGETTQTITVCESGDYYVTVTDESGCSGTSEDTVHVEIGQPVSPTVTADGPTEICEGDSVTLTANSPNAVSYQWYQNGIAIQGATGQSITVSDFADFYVVVTDQYGCTAQSNIVLVKVGVVPVVTVEDATICPGDEITLTASGATYYVWSNGATTQSINVSPDEATDYIVTGTNPFCNLSDSDTATVSISALPVAAANASDDPSLGNPVNFTDVSGDNSIVSWFWNFGDGNSAVTQNTHHTYDTEGTFTVILTVENQYGCSAYDTLEVDINQVILIPNIITPNNDGLNDGFGIKNNGVEEYGLTIFNRWGQIVFERQAREIQWNGTTNSGTDLEAGTYFYVLVVDNGSKGTFEKTGFITLVR